MVVAGVYCRLSPVPPDKRHLDNTGASLGGKRQQADGEALAEHRHWTVGAVYVDDDNSAFSGKARPAYDRMVADLRSGAINAVIAWHPDRLHRTPRELEDFIDLIEQTGAQVATCTAGDIDLSTPDGRALARIACVIARKESEDKSRRLRRKHKELAVAGKLSGGGQRPFGYEADRVTIRATEADEIRTAARRILAGESLRGITHDWRDRGVRTVTGALWSPTTVKRLLCSGRISGQREHRDPEQSRPGRPAPLRIVGPAVWPAIITPDQTARLRAILNRRAGAGPGNARSYLLTGFVLCGLCGTPLQARAAIRKGHRYRRYHCAKDRGGCDRVGISAGRLEEAITDAALDLLDGPTIAQLMRSDDDTDEARAIELVQELEAQLEQFAADLGDGVMGRSEWLIARSKIEPRLADAREVVARHRPANVLDGLPLGEGALVEEWPGLSLARQRAILGAVLESVTVAPTTRANNRFDETRFLPPPVGKGDVRWRI